MQFYRVGGAVRDRLLGLPVQDVDWVVVGATPEAMVAQGYQPVGKDFPVFLHPRTHEEYALARTERKSGHGYKGFTVFADPSVTLEEDLLRRDLTINAMAEDAEGNIIDPYHGRADLADRVLRHVSPAFAEDPVRILRLARFAARFGFAVAPETMTLMREMVASGEVDHLVPERVWQEISRGLMEAQPSIMFGILRESGALARIAPEIEALWGVPQRADYHPEVDTGVHVMLVLDYCAQQQYPLAVRWAALCHDLGKAATPPDILPRHIGHEARGVPLVEALCERLRVPVDCRELAVLCCREHTLVHTAEQLRTSTLLDLLQRCDALRRPVRFTQLLQACLADARGRTGFEQCAYPQHDYLVRALELVQAVDAGAVARQCAEKARIPEAVRQARLSALGAIGKC
ncbi:multifunctional CCA addition/repair protein [Chitinilyticum piscinae]|uniref:Multifunctional CCA protein n=1 Tax=Chitinilyticum piscinae TaxID=2866724 RepID=A0A8J7FW02_9NEIS|nr:multifunctional CCA addition/repair protein [Chitinilyticum piscinae]MBE9608030.1 multifunctional CCA addition/repair protein [Chitinilyticum piscinae]